MNEAIAILQTVLDKTVMDLEHAQKELAYAKAAADRAVALVQLLEESTVGLEVAIAKLKITELKGQ